MLLTLVRRLHIKVDVVGKVSFVFVFVFVFVAGPGGIL